MAVLYERRALNGPKRWFPARAVTASPVRDGMGPVIVPGQYERNAMAKRSAEGIPVAAGTYDQVRALRLPSVPSSFRLLSGSFGSPSLAAPPCCPHGRAAVQY